MNKSVTSSPCSMKNHLHHAPNQPEHHDAILEYTTRAANSRSFAQQCKQAFGDDVSSLGIHDQRACHQHACVHPPQQPCWILILPQTHIVLLAKHLAIFYQTPYFLLKLIGVV
jgi:hypothetical protein